MFKVCYDLGVCIRDSVGNKNVISPVLKFEIKVESVV